MLRILIAAFLILFSDALFGQMTVDQRVNDFQQLGALMSRRYSLVEWKANAFQYDVLDLRPWLERVRAAKDDLEFYEICTEYIARLQDGHSAFLMPSVFSATLGFEVDLVNDDKIIVDSITRTRLPLEKYPFEPGDELVSIDGKQAKDILATLKPLFGSGNTRSASRFAAQFLTIRYQGYIPRAAEHIGENAQVVIRRRASGAEETYTIPWLKSGVPFQTVGPVPDPKVQRPQTSAASAHEPVIGPDGLPSPPYMEIVRRKADLRSKFSRLSKQFLSGIGAVAPSFDLPAGTQIRRGTGRNDIYYYSAVIEVDGLKIGFLRVPDFSSLPSDFDTEIDFMQNNTDGVIVDMMRNPGGSGCTMESLARRFAPDGLIGLAVSTRVTREMVLGIEGSIAFYESLGLSGAEIDELKSTLAEYQQAYAKPRGFTFLEPICSTDRYLPPYRNSSGRQFTYSKPVVVLIDDLSSSAAEGFAAMMQDNKRALLYGYRTGGLGGGVFYADVGLHMEAQVYYTQSILVRQNVVSVPGYPVEPYIENIGVHPDIVSDPLSVDFIATRGKDWVTKMLADTVEYVKAKKAAVQAE
jgi:C-terminal processing protease CtpA/Prc